MPKIEVNKVAEICKKNEVPPALLRRIIEEMNLAVQPDDDEKPPAVKKQFCILISDPDGLLPKKLDFVGWVLQIPESESVATTIDRVLRSAYDFNTTKKGRLMPVKTIGEAIENVPAKLFKEADVWVKTKTPILMLKTDNEVPRENDTGKLPFERRSAGEPRTPMQKAFQRTLDGLGEGGSITITHQGKGTKITKDGVMPVGGESK
jgi:hypothetical protein